jgi:hypothetical protein
MILIADGNGESVRARDCSNRQDLLPRKQDGNSGSCADGHLAIGAANRATETKRRDAILDDPESARIHDAIKYNFKRHFGEPVG